MPDREKVISTLEEIKTQTAEIGLDSAVIAHEFIDKIIALLKEQDYRGWLMDMFHKYGRDDLIALLVPHGEENLIADVLKEQLVMRTIYQTTEKENLT